MYKLLLVCLLGLSGLNANAMNKQLTVTAKVINSCELVNTGIEITNRCNDKSGNFAINIKDLTSTNFNYEKYKTIEVGDIKVEKIGDKEYLVKVVTINF